MALNPVVQWFHSPVDGRMYPLTGIDGVVLPSWDPVTQAPPGSGLPDPGEEAPPPPPPPDPGDPAPTVVSGSSDISSTSSKVTHKFTASKYCTRQVEYCTDGGATWLMDTYTSPSLLDHSATFPAGSTASLPADTEIRWRLHLTDDAGNVGVTTTYSTRTATVATNPEPPPPTGGSGGNLLKWLPPVLSSPLQLRQTSPGPVNAGSRDVLIEDTLIDWSRGIELTNNGHVVLRNCLVKFSREYFDVNALNGTSDPGTNNNRGFYFRTGSGSGSRVIFMEGVHFDLGNDGISHLWEGINIADHGTGVQTHFYMQNCRFSAGARVHFPTSRSGHYGGDQFQCWSGPTRFWHCNNSWMEANYQAWWLQPRKYGAGPDRDWVVERTNFEPRQSGGVEAGLPSNIARTQSAHAIIIGSTDGAPNFQLSDVWAKPSPSRGSSYIAQDLAPDPDRKYPDWLGGIRNGVPPGGDFAPRSLWGADGRSYVTPGYESGATVAS